ncbi:MAG: hypothetical protein AB7O59_19805 [Pirellulales bacterium]
MNRRIIYTRIVEIRDEKPEKRVVVHHNHHHKPPVQRALPRPEPVKVVGETPVWVPIAFFGSLIFLALVIGKLLGT